MLQIVILHENDKSKILTVKNVNILGTESEVLCKFDEALNQTVLSPLSSYVGELVTVTHFNSVDGKNVYDY